MTHGFQDDKRVVEAAQESLVVDEGHVHERSTLSGAQARSDIRTTIPIFTQPAYY